jgi:hypothetical protein
MARTPTNGRATSVSTEDFNERVKRLVADKPDPQKAVDRRANASGSKKAGPGR